MGCHTEPAAVHIAHVVQRLHFFQFFNFFYNLHDLPQIKITRPYRKKKFIFFIIYTTYRKKKLHAFTAKKITRLDDFFVHDLHFSPWNLLFLNLGVYSLVQTIVGVGTVLIWYFCIAYTRGGGADGGAAAKWVLADSIESVVMMVSLGSFHTCFSKEGTKESCMCAKLIPPPLPQAPPCLSTGTWSDHHFYSIF